MTTATLSIPKAWTLLASGPLSSAGLQNRSGTLEYKLSTVLPAATETGHLLNLDAGHTITLSTGENLYAQSIGSGTSSIALTT